MTRTSPDALVSVVVPVCNEEVNVHELRARLTTALDGAFDFECIVVDDGSTDRTADLIREIAREDRRFKLVSLSRNFGHQAAIFAGLSFARGTCVAVMDGDLQDPPELIPDMVRLWEKGATVVYGVRITRKERRWKRAAAAIFYRLQAKLTQIAIPIDTGDFAVMDRRVVDLITRIGERHPYVRGLRSWVGFRQVAFPYERDARHRGKAKYTVWKLMDLAVAGIVPFSVVPLRLVALGGLAISALSLAAAVLLALGAVSGLSGLGSSSIVAGILLAVTLVFGMQLTALGVVGEYVGRVLEEVQNRPVFVVDELVGLDAETAKADRARRAAR